MKPVSSHYPVVVIGAGPAGLTAAYELVKAGVQPMVLEKGEQAGGISRTVRYKGYRFDIGGHRFFTKIPEVEALWHEILGPDFVRVPRLSRIYYDGKFYPYPLDVRTTLRNLGPLESSKILASYLAAKIKAPYPVEESLEQWVSNRFGPRLYQIFFKTYTEKVWGIPCSQIRADWAAQRIKQLSLKVAILKALFGSGDAPSLIDVFHYPVLGPGMMWERCAEHVERGRGEVIFNADVVRLHRVGSRITSVAVRSDGCEYCVSAGHVINSMPVAHLVSRMDPPPPEQVLEAARQLKYRDFLIVALVIDQADVFPDNWVYVHSPHVKVGRIQNFKNWSPAMVPNPSKTCLGMEYFCNEGDGLWEMPDDALIHLAAGELAQTGLAHEELVQDGTVIRQRMAYPVYDEHYKKNLAVIRAYLETLENVQTTGRAGMHRYNNQDHSMLTAMLAVRNILGQQYDLWCVNLERSYQEEFALPRQVPLAA